MHSTSIARRCWRNEHVNKVWHTGVKILKKKNLVKNITLKFIICISCCCATLLIIQLVAVIFLCSVWVVFGKYFYIYWNALHISFLVKKFLKHFSLFLPEFHVYLVRKMQIIYISFIYYYHLPLVLCNSQRANKNCLGLIKSWFIQTDWLIETLKNFELIYGKLYRQK